MTTPSISLPASKSLSNRCLIIQAMSESKIKINELSKARDTQTLENLLGNFSAEQNVKDAGTTMRFLTAFYAIQDKPVVLKGSDRMHERPIGILVDALNSLGAQIEYLNKRGVPPIKIEAFKAVNACQELEIDSSISSQYISALLMIAPSLPNGLFFKLKGRVASQPYIDMTIKLMEKFGIEVRNFENKIKVEAGKYTGGEITIESDWSAASYWYSYFVLSEHRSLELPGLQANSLQGDAVIKDIFTIFGVETAFNEKGALLTKKEKQFPTKLKLNFRNCPDLAQTLAVLCGFLDIELVLDGIESLRIKETDRVLALKTELSKIGVELSELGETSIKVKRTSVAPVGSTTINTYEDHRMAMAFAPLLTKISLNFDDKEVVNKSYPNFWKELNKLI